MSNVYTFWEQWLIPHAVQFYNNEYLSAIRNSFYRLMPFWLTLSIFDFVENVILTPNGIVMGSNGLNFGFWLTGGLSGDEYEQHYLIQSLYDLQQIVDFGYSAIAIVLVVMLARRLSEIWKSDTSLTMLCTLVAYIFMTTSPADTKTDFVDYFSERGFFTAFFTAFAASRLFAYLSTIEKLRTKTPKNMPDELARCITYTFPILFTLTAFLLLSFLLTLTKPLGEQFIQYMSDSTIFQEPLFVLLYQTVVWLLWWLGIPGYGVTSIIQETAYIPAQVSNQIGDASAIFTTGFFEAGIIHVMGLIIAIIVFSQHEKWRSMSKFSLSFMMFNIQEVFIFGLPVVLNPIFLVPYILAPLANTVVGYIAISWNIVPIFQIDMPWTMPLILSATIGTHSVMGGVLQIVWLIMDIFIYAPFVITANSVEVKD